MVWDRENENKSTYVPPSREQMDELRRQPQPGLQIVPSTPTSSINEIGRKPQPIRRERKPADRPVYH